MKNHTRRARSMNKFFDETMESLLQAVEIAKTRAKRRNII